jgi:hypothetical protein
MDIPEEDKEVLDGASEMNRYGGGEMQTPTVGELIHGVKTESTYETMTAAENQRLGEEKKALRPGLKKLGKMLRGDTWGAQPNTTENDTEKSAGSPDAWTYKDSIRAEYDNLVKRGDWTVENMSFDQYYRGVAGDTVPETNTPKLSTRHGKSIQEGLDRLADWENRDPFSGEASNKDGQLVEADSANDEKGKERQYKPPSNWDEYNEDIFYAMGGEDTFKMALDQYLQSRRNQVAGGARFDVEIALDDVGRRLDQMESDHNQGNLEDDPIYRDLVTMEDGLREKVAQ